jgi:ferrochelatase
MARYKGSEQPAHNSLPATGILITNLGTPDAPTSQALRRYLAEFLSDTRVIETSKLVWWPILYGIILTLRPHKSAEAYRKVWTNEGSPLKVISERQVAAIATHLKQQMDGPVVVELAMRYGNPSIRSALERMHAANVRRLLVFPLYPQYSATTTASTFDAVADVLKTWRWIPELRMINHYHDHAGYIATLAESIRLYRASHGKADKLLFSFHGLPRKYFISGDPYFCECQKTARLVAEHLQLEQDEWAVTFQSRFGPTEWLKPYTGDVLQAWAKSGTGSVQIVCPGFAADCLETLEEIQIQYRQIFLEAGGKQFAYIPALNDSAAHIDVLTDIILNHSQGWQSDLTDIQSGEVSRRAEKLLSNG